MPQHKSCKKRMKTSANSRSRNRATRTVLRSSIKDFRGNEELKNDDVKQIASVIDKSWTKGIIHKNKAARLKSRLAKFAAKAS